MYDPFTDLQGLLEMIVSGFSYLKRMRLTLFLSLLICGTLLAQEEIRRSIWFDGGSYEVDEEQAGQLFRWLDSIPNLLQKYHIELISHTDPIGGRRYNQWLSRMRSRQVEGLLQQRSIPAELIRIRDWGFDMPVYSNQDHAGMRMNRRVDVIVRPMVF